MTNSIPVRLEIVTAPVWWWVVSLYAVLVLVVGATLGAGGVVLVAAGGSPYYLLAGAGLVVVAMLVWRRDPRSGWLYGAMVATTAGWAVYEAGADFWSLVPRFDLVAGLGVPLLFADVRGKAAAGRRTSPRGWATLAAGIVTMVVAGAGLRAAFVPHRADPVLRDRALAAAPAPLPRPLAATAGDDWRFMGNDAGSTRFSPLADVNPSNVGRLAIAWTADTGPATKGFPPSFEATPINIGDALYLCSAYDHIIALDAETGAERWRYDMGRGAKPSGKPCRGVAYVHVAGATALCADRLLANSQEGDLVAVDTRTGKPCPGFGDGGHVSLRDGLGGRPDINYFATSPPAIVRGRAVVGGEVVDGQFWGEPSGVVRAYDVVTGKLAWAFDSGHPTGAPAPGQTYTPSSPNSWAPISADEALGLVYLPMGGSVPDFYGGKRRPSDELVATSVVAVDAETGAMRWRFQTVHHDLWDYDVSGQPTLVDLPTSAGVRKALIQVTKTGQIFVLDRATGGPIKAVAELPVPQPPAAPGERLSPTQPFSVAMPQFHSPRLREADMWGLTLIDQMLCRIAFRRSNYDGMFTPPSLARPAIFEPGPSGGMEWGGVSVDLDRGIAIVNSNRVPQRLTLMPQDDPRARKLKLFDGSGPGTLDAPQRNTPYAAVGKAFLSLLGVPCNAPPWGLITAVDLVSGEVIWHHRFGTGRDSGPLGIRSQMPFTMGVPNQGGSVATRGGLVFIGAAADDYLRAFDTLTGDELWRGRLPAGGQANPMIFRSPRSGREFIVIAAGGKPGMGTRLGTKVIAYALPELRAAGT